MINNLAPRYSFKPIARETSLAKLLGFDFSELENIASNVLLYYSKNKPDENGRITYTVSQPLKNIQKAIQRNLLKKVIYPGYLHSFVKKRSIVTNAELHLSKKIIIVEDVAKFFDSCNKIHIYNIWKGFFKFSENIATIMTLLTSLNGGLPQGASTSPSLSNLIFWKHEPHLVKELYGNCLTYSRYADDIIISSQSCLSVEDKKMIISLVYGILLKYGFKPKREKHKIYTSSNRMLVNGQTVNGIKVNLNKNAKGKDYLLNLRAEIHALEKNKDSLLPNEHNKKYLSALGKINRLSQYKEESTGLESLKNRLALLKPIKQ